MEKEVLDAFEAAKKAADAAVDGGGAPEVDRCVDALRRLRRIKVTMKVLVDTQVVANFSASMKYPLLLFLAEDVDHLVVSELAEFRNSFLQENQQLKETISVLESRIQHLERNASFSGSSMVKTVETPEEKNLIYQAETSREPVEDQDADNAMLDKVAHELHDDKVNEVHIKMNQHDIATKPTITELDHVTVRTRAAPSHDDASGNADNYCSFEQIHETFNIQHGAEDYGSVTRQGQISDLDESRISEDVVSVSLDNIQVQDSEQPVMRTGENSPAPISGSQELPLSDAPLIGAPFRLISYFAKYVTGADLVNQKLSI